MPIQSRPTSVPGDWREHAPRTGDPWDSWPNEPKRWHERFIHYRDMGRTRSIDGAYRIAAIEEGLLGTRSTPAWRKNAKEWFWWDRADAWDTYYRKRIEVEDQDRRVDAREKRVRIIDKVLHMVTRALVIADLPNMTTEEARRQLPTLRVLLRDMLFADRLEMGEPTEISAEGEMLQFSADDLAAAQYQINTWLTDSLDPERLLVVAPESQTHHRALENARLTTGLDFTHIEPGDPNALISALESADAEDRHYHWMQIDALNIEMDDDQIQRSIPHLDQIKLLILFNQAATAQNIWFETVPKVIRVQPGNTTKQEQAWLQAFWVEMSLQGDPDDALAAAGNTVPEMNEYIVTSWNNNDPFDIAG